MHDFDFWLNRKRLVAFQVAKCIELTSLEAFKDFHKKYEIAGKSEKQNCCTEEQLFF